MQTHSGTEIDRTAPIEDIEQRLDVIIRMYGEPELINVRNKAKELAHKLGMSKEFEKLDSIFKQLLPLENLKSHASHENKPVKGRFKRRI